MAQNNQTIDLSGAPDKLPTGKGPWLIAGGLLIFAVSMYFGLIYKVSHFGP